MKRMAVAFRAAQAKDEDFQKFMYDGKGDSVESKKVIDELRDLNMIEER